MKLGINLIILIEDQEMFRDDNLTHSHLTAHCVPLFLLPSSLQISEEIVNQLLLVTGRRTCGEKPGLIKFEIEEMISSAATHAARIPPSLCPRYYLSVQSV